MLSILLPRQQSAPISQLLPLEEKSLKQLSAPQTKSPSHCESSSQSPPPSRQGKASEQQFQSVEGFPLQLVPGSKRESQGQRKSHIFEKYNRNRSNILSKIFVMRLRCTITAISSD